MRLALAALVLVFLAMSAGCTLLGPGDVDTDELEAEAEYDWETSANVTITIQSDSYQAVYKIANQSELKVFRFHRFNNQRPIDPTGVQFRYPNGTIVGPEAMEFEKQRSGTVINLPGRTGILAFTGPKQGKQLRIPTVIEGSYEVILPEDTDVQYFLLGRVSPSGYERSLENDRVHLRWEDVSGDSIVVRYYLARDLLIFGSVVLICLMALIGGLGYFWLQLRTLREHRDEVALDDT